MVNKNIANGIICWLMAIAVCSNLVFAGCGNTGPQPMTSRPAMSIAKPVLEPAPDVSPTGEVNGTLNLAGSDPLTLDPATSGDSTSHQYIIQMFDGLVCLNDSMKPTADIAQSCNVSTDCKVYTFNLRHDVQFHDGRAVTAEDFKYSWE
jgi:oligopeptide transport system substrate-binding protein